MCLWGFRLISMTVTSTSKPDGSQSLFIAGHYCSKFPILSCDLMPLYFQSFCHAFILVAWIFSVRVVCSQPIWPFPQIILRSPQSSNLWLKFGIQIVSDTLTDLSFNSIIEYNICSQLKIPSLMNWPTVLPCYKAAHLLWICKIAIEVGGWLPPNCHDSQLLTWGKYSKLWPHMWKLAADMHVMAMFGY